MACAIAIFLYVQDELIYDTNHENAENIYRLTCTYYLPNDAGQEDYAVMGGGVAQHLVNDYPEILQSVRFRRRQNRIVRQADGTENYETIHLADSNVFQLFTFPLIEGDPQTALDEPFEIVLSQDYAIKYFNRLDIVGEQLFLPEDSISFTVTGVLAEIPQNSHIRFDMLASFQTLYETEQYVESWWSFGTYTYVELSPKANVDELGAKIKRISANYIANQEEQSGYYQEYFLQNLTEIHLNSDLRSEWEANSKEAYVYVFAIVGIFIMLIACINFMNLATARSAKRAKEIGVRKVSGADRHQLIWQFLGESILMSFIALLISLAFIFFILDGINDFTGKSLSIVSQSSAVILGGTLIFGLLIGLIAGIYPALILSSFQPTSTLKGSIYSSSKGNVLRKMLVVFQFIISIFMIGGTFATSSQLNFMRNKSLGFDKEQTIYIPTRYTATALQDFTALKNNLDNESGIVEVSLSSRVPGEEMGNNVVRLGWAEDAEWSDMRFIAVDFDFIALYNLDLVAGRPFDEDISSDISEGFILNEAGAERLGWSNPEDAIGKELGWQRRRGRVIGVLKDFHFMSANQSIEPFIVVMIEGRTPGYISIKISGDNFRQTLSTIETAHASVMPNKLFEYSILDDDFDLQYKAEERFMTLFTIFSTIAILVACMGLYGLASFIAEVKFKEIGIRKVLGANTMQMVLMLNKDFTILVGIAMVIAVPLGYFAADYWVQSFPYKANLSVYIFVLAGIVSLVISWITVSYQSYRAASINPVKSIATE
jgi:putative ABC transport system permease protein